MDLLALIALIILIYVSWKVYQTFYRMEQQLQELKLKCSPASSNNVPPPETSVAVANPIASRLIEGLQRAMLVAS